MDTLWADRIKHKLSPAQAGETFEMLGATLGTVSEIGMPVSVGGDAKGQRVEAVVKFGTVANKVTLVFDASRRVIGFGMQGSEPNRAPPKGRPNSGGCNASVASRL